MLWGIIAGVSGGDLDRAVPVDKEGADAELVLVALQHRLQAGYALKMVHSQYATVGSTIRSCLSYLRSQKQLESAFDENLMYWQSV